MADVTTEAAADDEDGVNSPNTQKRLDFAAALKKDAPSPGVARRIIEGADGGVRIARVVPACPRKSHRQTSPPPSRAQDGGEHTPKTRRRIANMLVEGKDAPSPTTAACRRRSPSSAATIAPRAAASPRAPAAAAAAGVAAGTHTAAATRAAAATAAAARAAAAAEGRAVAEFNEHLVGRERDGRTMIDVGGVGGLGRGEEGVMCGQAGTLHFARFMKILQAFTRATTHVHGCPRWL